MEVFFLKMHNEKGFSLIEIGIALVLAGIFLFSSITLLSASNENYRRIEQRSIALSYAMKAIEVTRLKDAGLSLEEVKNKALVDNNMEVDVDIQNVVSSDGTKEIQILTANVIYHVKSNVTGELQTLSLQTLHVNK